jgi:hypothetical protein
VAIILKEKKRHSYNAIQDIEGQCPKYTEMYRIERVSTVLPPTLGLDISGF